MAYGRKGSRPFALLVLLLGLLIAAAAGGQRWVVAKLGPVNPAAQEQVIVEIPGGATTTEVAHILFERGLIQDPTIFRFYTRYRQLDGKIMSGQYQLSASMSMEAILGQLIAGQVLVNRVTIPEGLTVAMVADLLVERQVVSREGFLEAVRGAAPANPYLPAGLAVTQPMEGYLFPATYDYGPGATAEEIVTQMFQRFQQVWSPELIRRAEEVGLSVHQVVTLASIVETEAQVAAEQPAIAGVYLNRLSIDMPLQADPTVYYALDLPRSERLLYKHLEVDSPYNTYMYPDLPPGPIAAPGESAIRAVLYPEKHDLFYFVAKEDGSGEHYFGRTLEEHDENVARAEANRKK